MSVPSNVLGEFLRAHRGRVRPAQAGLPDTGQRRVPGLRRAEVALLAGISRDYYLRLEQGRDRNPSSQVLRALAEVFGLDATGTQYLLSLSRPALAPEAGPRHEIVPDGVAKLLAALELPAFVENRFFDVLAANPLASALSPRLRAGENRLLSLFLDADEQALFPDWLDTTARMVAGFRRSVGPHTDEVRVEHLVEQLSVGSERFRTLWARQDVQPQQSWPVTLNHPRLGVLTLNREKLVVVDSPERMVLAVHHPDPGTESAEKLALLSTHSG